MENTMKYINVDELLNKLSGTFSVRQMDLIKEIIYSCEIKEAKNA